MSIPAIITAPPNSVSVSHSPTHSSERIEQKVQSPAHGILLGEPDSMITHHSSDESAENSSNGNLMHAGISLNTRAAAPRMFDFSERQPEPVDEEISLEMLPELPESRPETPEQPEPMELPEQLEPTPHQTPIEAQQPANLSNFPTHARLDSESGSNGSDSGGLAAISEERSSVATDSSSGHTSNKQTPETKSKAIQRPIKEEDSEEISMIPEAAKLEVEPRHSNDEDRKESKPLPPNVYLHMNRAPGEADESDEEPGQANRVRREPQELEKGCLTRLYEKCVGKKQA